MTERGYVLTSQARQDLHDIVGYIASENPTAAVGVLEEIRLALRTLGTMPGIGHAREDLADEALRFWPVRSYYVI